MKPSIFDGSICGQLLIALMPYFVNKDGSIGCIAAECGCIQSGICPKSALVDDWISFYKKQHRWARGDYIPHSGDFIIFDWEGDGQPDHIGIVESCDGKTVYTIKGNSRDVCRRKVMPEDPG